MTPASRERRLPADGRRRDPRSRRRSLAGAAGLACLVALAGPRGSAAADAVRFLAEGGAVFTWDGLSAALGHEESTISPPGASIRGLLEAGPHTLIVLAAASAEAGRSRHRREGEARLFDPSVPPPRLLHTISFEGEPLEGVVSTNQRKAWVLAYRPPDAAGAPPRSFLHALDLGSGRLEASSEPGAPVSGIALDSEGGRLYASQKDRIQTFGLQPLVASWHLRSPGLNGPLALIPGTGILCVVRGSELAVFDPAIISGRDAADRRTRTDDASSVVHLPFQPDRLVLSDDGRLALLSAPGTMVFVEPGSQAMIWPGDSVAGLRESAAVHALAFPGTGRDLIVALLPSGAVTAVRTPAPQPKRMLAPEPPTSAAPGPAAPAPGQTAPAQPEPAPNAASAAAAAEPPGAAVTPQAATPPAATTQGVSPPAPTPAPAPPSATSPPATSPPATPPAAPSPAPSPAPTSQTAPESAAPNEETPRAPATLAGKVTGDAARVRAVVLYGPNNILKEFARVRPGADGTWSVPLPPAGAYRVLLVGDGSTPLPVKPGYIALKVVEGAGQSGLDFEVRPAP
ncbi:MAG TPA: hypothetical protein VFB49_07695 [Patescibacteria group bacterium]|nr:hypothetical protein [Patescibacteria group bacterium]